MKDGPLIASIAAMMGDPARANMLTALMDGRALTVSELAESAGVTIQTTSSHCRSLMRRVCSQRSGRDVTATSACPGPMSRRFWRG